MESDRDVGGEGWNMTSSSSEPEYTMIGRLVREIGTVSGGDVNTCRKAYREGPETEHRKEGKWNNWN